MFYKFLSGKIKVVNNEYGLMRGKRMEYQLSPSKLNLLED